MMEAAVEELTPVIGTRAACRALGVAPATLYRRRQPPKPCAEAPAIRQPPAHALTETERNEVLAVLRTPRFVDSAPAQVWATLLDEGTFYLRSELR